MKRIYILIALVLSLCILAGCDKNDLPDLTDTENMTETDETSLDESTEMEIESESKIETSSQTDAVTETVESSQSELETAEENASLTETGTETVTEIETETETETETVIETDTETESETVSETETKVECVHVFGEWTTESPATCTEMGKEIRSCECGETEERPLDMIDHIYGEWVIVGDPGCTDMREFTRSCDCGSEQNKIVAPIGHSENIIPAKFPTDTESGYTEEIGCKTCNQVIKESQSVSMLTLSEVDILADVTYVGNRDGILTFRWKVAKEYKDKLLGMKISVTNGSKVLEYGVFDYEQYWVFNAQGTLVRYTFTFTPITIDGVQGNAFTKEFYWFPDTYSLEFPRIEVYTENGELPTFTKTSPPVGAWGGGITNANYVPSIVSLYNKDNTLLYTSESSGYDGAKIKVRGNTSAYSPKHPFKIKLNKKFDLLGGLIDRDEGVDYRNKEWVLLKGGDSTNIAIGSAISELVGNEWTPQYCYVTLFVNGEYRGLYVLIESIDQDEARCDVSDSGFIVEYDAYWWNEPLYFTTPISENRGAKPTFKYPDSDELTLDDERVEYIQQYLTDLENILLGNTEGDINDYLDMQSFVRWMMTHDILASWDSGGSNMYMLKYDNTPDSKMRMGPVWDYDSIYWSADKYNRPDTFARLRYEDHFYMHFLADEPEFLEIYTEEYAAIRDRIIPTVSAKFDEFKNETYLKLLSYETGRWGGAYEDPAAVAEVTLAWFEEHLTWMDKNVDTPYGVQ